MKTNDVIIYNWQAPGEQWWGNVESKPDEPLIVAKLVATMSWREYHDLLDDKLAIFREALRKIAEHDYSAADTTNLDEVPTMIWQAVAREALKPAPIPEAAMTHTAIP